MRKQVISRFVPALVWAAFAGAGLSASARDMQATLQLVEGTATVRGPGVPPIPASTGMVLFAGSEISTGDDGRVTIAFVDRALLRVEPRSRFVWSPHRRSEEAVSLRLFFGRIWSKIIPNPERRINYLVNTPNAVAGVRGTEFEVGVGDDAGARIRVDGGEVLVRSKGAQVSAGTGKQVDVNERRLGEIANANPNGGWNTFFAQGNVRLKQSGPAIMTVMQATMESRRLEARRMVAEQETLAKRHAQLSLLPPGDAPPASAEEPELVAPNAGAAAAPTVGAELAAVYGRLSETRDRLADLSDQAASDFGFAGHLQESLQGKRGDLPNRQAILGAVRGLLRMQPEMDAILNSGFALGEKIQPPVVNPAAKAEEPGANFANEESEGGRLSQRVRDIHELIRARVQDAQAQRDTVKANCIQVHLSSAQGLIGIAQNALSSLQQAAAQRDAAGVQNAMTNLGLAAQKAEQLLSEASTCTGEADNYKGGTKVEVESDEDVTQPDIKVSPPPPILVRPPAISPYQ